MKNYYPEGMLFNTTENMQNIKSVFALQESMTQGKILEAKAIICDNDHNLIVDLPCAKGIIPRQEGAIGIDSGATKDIALITRVNKPVCFKITSISKEENGSTTAYLSRKIVQEECMKNYIESLKSGDIIPAKVTHLEQFGAFVDIGCGIPSLIPIDAISISRISHPSDRFTANQDIKVIVKSVSNGRVWLSHKELLGTWQENADQFNYGETVSGIVRSVEDYGIFVELAPNLAGLAEPRENVKVGQHASIYIKAIIPDKMKIKLIIVDVFDAVKENKPMKYYVESNHISEWIYSTPESDRIIRTDFTL